MIGPLHHMIVTASYDKATASHDRATASHDRATASHDRAIKRSTVGDFLS